METLSSLDICDSAPIHRLGQYSAWSPPGSPNLPVDLIWCSVAHDHNPMSHRVLPHGEPSIAILRRFDAAGDVYHVELTICGSYLKSHWYHPAPKEQLLALRLRPEISAQVFGLAPREFMNTGLVAAPRALTEACERSLRAAETQPAFPALRMLADDLMRCAGSAVDNRKPEIYAADLIRRTNGAIRCRHVADQLGLSERHLRRRFRDATGFSPKEYARRHRLSATVIAAEAEAAPDWAQLATTHGFHDQPHMINDFKTLLDMTPQQIHVERRALSGFCNTNGPH